MSSSRPCSIFSCPVFFSPQGPATSVNLVSHSFLHPQPSPSLQYLALCLPMHPRSFIKRQIPTIPSPMLLNARFLTLDSRRSLFGSLSWIALAPRRSTSHTHPYCCSQRNHHHHHHDHHPSPVNPLELVKDRVVALVIRIICDTWHAPCYSVLFLLSWRLKGEKRVSLQLLERR